MAYIDSNDLQKRKLHSNYLSCYVITKEIKIKGVTAIEEKTLYFIYGVTPLGNRQILKICFQKKDNRFWLEVFEDFKARGVENIRFLVTPKNRQLERCSKLVYNSIKIVESPEEIMQSINKYFAEKKSRRMKTCFKNLFLSEDTAKLKEELELFKEQYVNNTIILMILNKNEEKITKFYEYSYEIRKLLYPYYAIIELKKHLNKMNNLEEILKNENEVIEFCISYVNTMEKGRSQSKSEWLQLLSKMYEENKEEMECYLI